LSMFDMMALPSAMNVEAHDQPSWPAFVSKPMQACGVEHATPHGFSASRALGVAPCADLHSGLRPVIGWPSMVACSA
jgi:hypothetical protein